VCAALGQLASTILIVWAVAGILWFFGFDSQANRTGPNRHGTGQVPTAGVPGTIRCPPLIERLARRMADPTRSQRKPDLEHGRIVSCHKDVIRLFLPPREDGLTLKELVTRQGGNPAQPDTIAFHLEVGSLTPASRERIRRSGDSLKPEFIIYKYDYTIADVEGRGALEGEKRGALEAVIEEARGLPPPEGTAWDGNHYSVSYYEVFQNYFKFGHLPKLSLDGEGDSGTLR
jgi:hypothetical protein